MVIGIPDQVLVAVSLRVYLLPLLLMLGAAVLASALGLGEVLQALAALAGLFGGLALMRLVGKTAKATARYTVRLHFGKPLSESTTERVMEISLEGKQVLRGFDVAREAGDELQPVVREFRNIEVTGPLDIKLSALQGQTTLSGVEIIRDE